MLLGFDIGNTHICPIVYDIKTGEILKKFRLPSKILYTEDTLFTTLKVLLEENNFKFKDIKDIAISSVVPHLNEIFIYFTRKYLKKEPYLLSSKFLTDDILSMPNSTEKGLGSDRILAILAAQKKYLNKKIIIIDFGTATTFEIIDKNIYLGGAILPGIELSINALFQNTAKLPKVRFERPKSILANSTITQINTGIYYGNLGAIRELITMYKKIYPDAYVISTGGQGKEISYDLEIIDEYDPLLCEKGLFEYYLLEKK